VIRRSYSSSRGPIFSGISLGTLLMNTLTGSTLTLANLNSVLLDFHGRLDLPTGGSTHIYPVSTHVQHFKSLVREVPRYSLLTFVQVPSVRCPACCRRWSPRKISSLPTLPSHWMFPFLGCIYHFLSTRIGSSSVEACQVTLLTRLSRAEQCSA
jgi:hypothetical protein